MNAHRVESPPKARPGDRVAVVSPSWAAPAVFPAIHEQAMRRLADATGLVPIEFPTTRRLDASPEDRASDLMSAFADPSIRAIVATIGGEDQLRVIPHLDPDIALRDPKPFVGYSDNTNLLHWLWTIGIGGFYGGSTQVHVGPGPGIDEVHLRSLRAALLDGGALDIIDPGESEDLGIPWDDPRSLREHGEREATEPWTWSGGSRPVSGRTWGGCLEVLDWIMVADRFPFSPDVLDGTILLMETSETLPSADWVSGMLQAMGERGLLAPLAGVIAARPPTSSLTEHPEPAARAARREAQRDAILTQLDRYCPDAVVCVGPPFGHTRPQWILPHGGPVALDPSSGTISATYSW
ncbi:S66 family peptidase [Agromyces sp. SYSU T0242]|uniref:S66 family peptidase n=1 Tax=Agromyces litoreus TaxID=3158561 RepID=UPI003397DD78